MKYGRLVYRYSGKTYENDNAIFNIGDNVQTYAIDNLYRRMGISSDDIIDINFAEMANYDGEYVIVPMAGYASHYKRFSQLPASSKIIPVFVSFEMSDKNCDDIVPYLKQNGPIGCRDEHTMILLRDKGIEAYLSGCLTITLPRRKNKPENGKVFLVDISSKLENYIPENIRSRCEYVKHEGVIGHFPMTEKDRIEIDEYAKKVYTRYAKEADLVITSRLHAAAPCIAMGIPVIVAIDNIDGRFSWLDKLVPLYDSQHYNEIDWNPQAIDIEEIKEKYILNVIERIKAIKKEKSGMYNISSFWENRKRTEYNAVLKSKLCNFGEKYKNMQKLRYVIWGAGVHGKLAYSMVEQEFPNSELIAVVDNYMTGEMFGVPLITPSEVKKMDYDYAIITTHLGRFEAVDILTSLGKEKNKDWCYFISKDVPEED